MMTSGGMQAVRADDPEPGPTTLHGFAQPNQALNALWTTYGNVGGHWTGGDRTVSVPLPDGRTAWLFSDSYLGTVNPDGSRPTGSPVVNNLVVVQNQDGTLGQTVHGGTIAQPKALVAGADPDLKYWVGDGLVSSGSLKVLYNVVDLGPGGGLDIKQTGTSLVTLSLPSFTVESVQQLPLGDKISWGSELVTRAGYTYIYGAEHNGDQAKYAHVARVPAGELGGAWQFWTGSSWSAEEADSERLLTGVGTGFSVAEAGGRFVLLTVDTNLSFNNSLVAYTADQPTGPFTDPRVVYEAPEPVGEGNADIVYDAALHPQLSTSGGLVASYNVNSLSPGGAIGDVSAYRPRFLDVTWPLPADPAVGTPPAPTNVSAATDEEGRVILAWDAVGGAERYRVYQRDLSNGQEFAARYPWTTTETSATVGDVRDGHEYEYFVRAENEAGEGAASSEVSVTAEVSPPLPVSGLVASVGEYGTATLTWQPSPTSNVWHTVDRRDVTAGEEEYARIDMPDAMAVTVTDTTLDDGHAYEYKVTAHRSGLSSATSPTVSVTGRFILSDAPSNLTATPLPTGRIALAWTAPAGIEPWYQVYSRDVTANPAAEWQMWEYPATSAAAEASYLEHGHKYEFKVSARTRGGEGPTSPVVAAIASFNLPIAPQGVAATSNGDGTIGLTWNEVPDTWARVYQRDVTAGETTMTAWELPITSPGTASATYLAAGHEYEFKVALTNQAGEGPASALVRATAVPSPPPSPTNLVVSQKPDATLELTWESSRSDLWYRVYQRDVTAGSGFVQWPDPTPNKRAVAQYLQPGHTYEYKVSAIYWDVESPLSAPAQAVSRYLAPTTAPAGFTVRPTGTGKALLSWQPVAGAWYWVYQRDVTANGAFVKWEYPAQVTTAEADYLVNGRDYEFKVVPYNPGGNGPSTAAIKIKASGGMPAKPTITAATAGDGKVTLSWSSAGSGVYYWVYRRNVSSGAASFTKLTNPTQSLTFTDTYLNNGDRYEYRVSASNAYGEGLWSAAATATPLPPKPAAPTAPKVVAGDGKVTFSWGASANAWYVVEYRDVTAGQVFKKVETLSAATTWTHTFLTNGHTYEYRVSATNLGGTSAATAVVQAKPMPPKPGTVTGLTATTGNGRMDLQWTTIPGAWYWVYRRDLTLGESFKKLPVPATASEFHDTLLKGGHKYEFYVVAYNIAGTGPSSAVVSGTVPMPAAPSGTPDVTVGPYSATIDWSPVTGMDGYFVEVGYRAIPTNLGNPEFTKWTRLPVPIVSGSQYKVRSLVDSGYYNFRLRSVKNGIVGAPSTISRSVRVLRENPYYSVARARLFRVDSTPATAQLVGMHVDPDPGNAGILVSRAFIAEEAPYAAVSDGRGYSEDPSASARIHVAWDVANGEWAALAQASCVGTVLPLIGNQSLCKNAIPLFLQYAQTPDSVMTNSNSVWQAGSSPGRLSIGWEAANSVTSRVPFLTAQIDTVTHFSRVSGDQYAATLRTDKFPTYEVYQYPRYSVGGDPEAITLLRCGQGQIDGLSLGPGEQRTCS